MRIVHAVLLLFVSACPALAQRAPVIVIPGRPDVPVQLDGVLPLYMNGADASWSVIEGEFGLDRPGEMTPTVIYRLPPVGIPSYAPAGDEPGYFPRDGKRPGYGRLEVVPPPNRRLPPPAPSFRQHWSSQSEPGPATVYPPSMVAPFVVSPVVVAPGGGRHWQERHQSAPQAPGNGMGNE
jgi:hypothetical protein